MTLGEARTTATREDILALNDELDAIEEARAEEAERLKQNTRT